MLELLEVAAIVYLGTAAGGLVAVWPAAWLRFGSWSPRHLWWCDSGWTWGAELHARIGLDRLPRALSLPIALAVGPLLGWYTAARILGVAPFPRCPSCGLREEGPWLQVHEPDCPELR